MSRSRAFSVLLDEGAPRQTGRPFEQRGHRVIYHEEVLAPGTDDKVVCATAIFNDAALVAVDRDFKRMAKRFGTPTGGPRYERLSLIFLNCKEVLAPKRLEHLMT